MARGYPDFFGQSIFPKYGKPELEGMTGIKATGLDWKYVFQTDSKGRSYGGYFHVKGISGLRTGYKLRYTIDGSVYTGRTVEEELDYGFQFNDSHLFFLTRWAQDDINQNICHAFTKDWTWEQSLFVEMQNTSGVNLTVIGYFQWAKVI